jgi:mannose-6-phosphate isomerase-like protein (cupin superfamily)
MTLEHPLVDIKNLGQIVPGKPQFLTPITIEHGSSTLAFYSLSLAHETTPKHRHNNCDEVSILLSGSGIYNFNGKRVIARAGDCRMIPKKTEHFFINQSDENAIIVGFFVGAENFTATGSELASLSQPEDISFLTDRDEIEKDGIIIVNVEDVTPETMDTKDGWKISDFRLPISNKNNYSSTLFRACFMPGSVHKKHIHENCDEIYYIISGHGLAGAGADRVEVHAGQFHFIRKGVEHWLHNLSQTEPIEVVGIYCGSGSVAETGYIYKGEVTANDLTQRTG